MTSLDWFCVLIFAIGLALLAVAMFRQAYRRANPKPRLPGPFTRWEDGA